MAKRLFGTVALLVMTGGQMPAQEFPPGYVDPAPLLAAVAEEIGEAGVTCMTYSGTGYSGAVGQTFENAVNIDWPRIDSMANYTRTINWEAGTSTGDVRPRAGAESRLVEVRDRLAGRDTDPEDDPPDPHRQWRVCLAHRWRWATVAVPPELAEVYQLDMWLNPHGFLKAARLPWRESHRLLAVGADREGPRRERGGPREDARGRDHDARQVSGGRHDQPAESDTADQDNGEHPALGDFNIEHESTNQAARSAT